MRSQRRDRGRSRRQVRATGLTSVPYSFSEHHSNAGDPRRKGLLIWQNAGDGPRFGPPHDCVSRHETQGALGATPRPDWRLPKCTHIASCVPGEHPGHWLEASATLPGAPVSCWVAQASCWVAQAACWVAQASCWVAQAACRCRHWLEASATLAGLHSACWVAPASCWVAQASCWVALASCRCRHWLEASATRQQGHRAPSLLGGTGILLGGTGILFWVALYAVNPTVDCILIRRARSICFLVALKNLGDPAAVSFFLRG